MTQHSRPTYLFDGFRFEALRNRLTDNGGSEIALKPKTCEILKVFLDHPGQLISKDEMMQWVWPDSFVEEGNLLVHISYLRKALGDSTDKARFILTIPGRGYRFLPDVDQLANGKIAENESRGIEQEYGSGRGQSVKRGASTVLKLVAASLALLILSLTVVFFLTGRRGAARFTDLRLTKLTSSGKATHAAVSPDGKFVAYVLKEVEGQSVWLRQLSASSDVQIMTAEASFVDYDGLAFSPDGQVLYFLKSGNTGPVSLYRTSTLGGPAEKLADDVDCRPGISPDGKMLAFIRGLPDQNIDAIFLLDVVTGQTRQLVTRPHPEGFVFSANPAWSPTGKQLICAVRKQDGEGKYNGLVTVDTDNGKIGDIAPPHFQRISQTAWVPGSSNLLIAASNEQSGERDQLWLIDASGSTVRRITNDLNDYSEISLTADGGTLIAINTTLQSNIWTSADPKSGEKQITTNNQDGNNGVAWAPNGDLIYSSRGADNLDLWCYAADGSRRQITSAAGNNSNPAISPDGNTIAFVSDRDGAQHIWLMGKDGSDARKLTNGSEDGAPNWSPDGKTIAFRSYINGNPFIYRISSTGGTPEQLTDKISGRPQFSPDGQSILTSIRPVALSSPKLMVIPAAGGEPEMTLDISTPYYRWSDQGRAILYISAFVDNFVNIWRHPIGTYAAPSTVTGWSDKRVFAFDIAPDGKTLAYARGERLSDVVLITDHSTQK